MLLPFPLLALAHHFEKLRTQGVVEDYADLARLDGVTRARMRQIMSSLNLAPDIQEEVLYLSRTTQGRDAVSARTVLPIAQEMDWGALAPNSEGAAMLMVTP